MISKHIQALIKPHKHWEADGYSNLGNHRFHDETRRVRMVHRTWDWLEQFLVFRIAVAMTGSLFVVAVVFGALYWIATHVRVTIV